MVPTPKYELIQDRLGTSLAKQLRAWQAAGLSAPSIARILRSETRVRVSAETVRVWLRYLDEENAA